MFRLSQTLGSSKIFRFAVLLPLIAILLTGTAIANAAQACGTCDARHGEFSELEAELSNFEELIDGLEQDLQDIDLQLTDLDAQVSEKQAKFDKQLQANASSESGGSTTEARYNDQGQMEVRTDGGDWQVSRTNTALTRAKAEIDALKEEIETLEDGGDAIEGLLDTAELAEESAFDDWDAKRRELAQCALDHCVPSSDLALNPQSHYTFHLGADDPHAALSELGISNGSLYPIPEDAGGGWQVTAPKPANSLATEGLFELLRADARVSSVEDDFCRIFLPEANGTIGSEAVVPAGRQSMAILKGTAITGTSQPLTAGVVLLFPEEPAIPNDSSDSLPWMPWDALPPPLTVPWGSDFVLVLPENLSGPMDLVLASGWDQISQPLTVDPTPVDVGPGSAEGEPGVGASVADGATSPSIVTSSPGDLASTTKPQNGTGTQTGEAQSSETKTVETPTVETPTLEIPGDSNHPEEEEECTNYCGPEMKASIAEAANRIKSRIDDLPSNERGFADGLQFLLKNADGFDNPVADLRPEDWPEDKDFSSEFAICPTGECAKIGQTPFTLGGYCLPKHMSNEILASMVASGVGVPLTVFQAGANAREIVNYSFKDGSGIAIEGDAPDVAYDIGYTMWETVDDLGSITGDQVASLVDKIMKKGLFDSNLEDIQEEYPDLVDCDACPDSRPGRFTSDFTKNPWTLADGTKVSPDE